MAIARVTPLMGINRDLSATELPIGYVTDANNVRFREGYAEPFLGHTAAYPVSGSPIPVAPYSAFPIRLPSGVYWIVAGANKVYAVTGTPAVWTDITRTTGGNYAATLDIRWNGGILSGVPILNNGVDIPQMWNPADVATKLTALANWPANDRALVMRPWRFNMVALNMTVGGVRRPYRLKISGPADPGSVPASWDETSLTSNVYLQDLDGAGNIVDGLTMREAFIIYRENSTYKVTFTGGDALYSVQPLFTTSGILARDCVVEVDGSHFVLTNTDLIVHDGNSLKSVLDKGSRRTLFQTMSPEFRQTRCFLVKNIYFNEVWVCYPSLESTGPCDRALVYNYKDNTISFRDIPQAVSGNTGQVDDSINEQWDSDQQEWDQDNSAWNEIEFGAQQERTLLSVPSRPGLALIDSGTLFFDQLANPRLERQGLALDAPELVKTVTRIRPRVSGPTGTVIMIRAMGSMTPTGAVEVKPWVPYTIGTQQTVDLFATGKFITWQAQSFVSANWRIEGLDIEFRTRGRF